MSALMPCGVCGCVPLTPNEAVEVEKLRAELAAAREVLRGWIEARDALFEYERKYPNSSGREWRRLFDAVALAEDAARTALGDTP